MRPISRVIVLVLLPLLAGCPFESKVPAGGPDGIPIDPNLVGDWAGRTLDGKDTVQVLVLPFNPTEYYIEVPEAGGKPDRYRGALVEIGGARFLRIAALTMDPEAPSFIYARTRPSADGGLIVRFVGDKLVPRALQSDAPGLEAFIQAHLDDPALDDPDVGLAVRRAPSGREGAE